MVDAGIQSLAAKISTIQISRIIRSKIIGSSMPGPQCPRSPGSKFLQWTRRSLPSAARHFPVTCAELENCKGTAVPAKLKPVMAVAAMGETPMSPLMMELGTVEMPLFARTAKRQPPRGRWDC
jgi:hypothetical protein